MPSSDGALLQRVPAAACVRASARSGVCTFAQGSARLHRCNPAALPPLRLGRFGSGQGHSILRSGGHC
eukprot:12884759-Alexandrium_andersonii.AAC.1